MPLVDRDEVLERVNLAELATDLCGFPQGRGRGARWHCPSPDHPDEHPSMGIFRSQRGHQRWKCHACGEGGTAVDLLMLKAGVGAGEALRDLARQVGLDPTPIPRIRRDHPVPAGAKVRTPVVKPQTPHPAIERFVAQAADLLWQPIADGPRRHLHARGFTERLLRLNRIGFDPGPRQLARPPGLPRAGPGIVYPINHPDGGPALSYQLRYLNPHTAARRKYDQPTADLAPNPRIALLRTERDRKPGMLVICEGIPDALTAAHTGHPALAVLGVTHAATDNVERLAQQITTRYRGIAFTVCFDNDHHGTTAANRLAEQLAHHGATVTRLQPPQPHNDLNGWWQAAPTALTAELTRTADLLVGPTTDPTHDITVGQSSAPRTPTNPGHDALGLA